MTCICGHMRLNHPEFGACQAFGSDGNPCKCEEYKPSTIHHTIHSCGGASVRLTFEWRPAVDGYVITDVSEQ